MLQQVGSFKRYDGKGRSDSAASFPERHDAEDSADAYFHFTIKNQSTNIELSSPRSPHGSSTLFHGNCVFRQEYDRQTKRRFNQKSLVLISHHEFTALFRQVLHAIIAHDHALSDPDRLEAVTAEMANWISPGIGQLQLPLFGRVFNFDIPPHSSFPLQGLRSVTEIGQNIFVSAYEPTANWQSILPYFYTIKELYHTFEQLFLGNSVIVLAKSPQLCSTVVTRLLDLIKPVPWGGLCRPYLIMQSEFFAGSPGATESTALPRNFIVGITNPFLLKRIISAAVAQKYAAPHVVQLKEELDPISPPIRLRKSLREKVSHSPPQKIDIPGGLDPIEVGKKHLRADEDFLIQLFKLLQDPSSSQNMIENLVCRHFADLAATLLAPINRYLATHLAATAPNSEHKTSMVEYANFNPDEFMKALHQSGTGVKWRGRALSAQKSRNAFFETFLAGPNFFAWMEVKSSLEAEARAGLLNEKSP